MKGIYLINYAVKGIKTLDEWARLSFYKKTISKRFNIHDYNVKGIYGTNGAGKSAIITSVKILKGAISDANYLGNPLLQEKLNELINVKSGKLEIDCEYLVLFEKEMRLFRYRLTIAREHLGRFYIDQESLTVRNATSHVIRSEEIYRTEKGETLTFPYENLITERLHEQTKNLFSAASVTALALEKSILSGSEKDFDDPVLEGLIFNFLFASSLYIYISQEDDHTDFVVNNVLKQLDSMKDKEKYYAVLAQLVPFERAELYELSTKTIKVNKETYEEFVKQIARLKLFLRIFKRDLKDIIIDRKESKDYLYCSLILDYDSYKVHAEFESAGIKKLICLFPYLQKMAAGEIVFIDEMDSSLHDVYLCALLEYLMEYGQGQLCFTTHNIGPMDVLKKKKKSIDFLSVDHKIYSWVTNGNYSPSKLYRNGMIEGSPFNLDPIDFLGIFEGDGD